VLRFVAGETTGLQEVEMHQTLCLAPATKRIRVPSQAPGALQTFFGPVEVFVLDRKLRKRFACEIVSTLKLFDLHVDQRTPFGAIALEILFLDGAKSGWLKRTRLMIEELEHESSDQH
jgi:hypothetical protein